MSICSGVSFYNNSHVYNVASVRTLIERDVDINDTDEDGLTPLHWAAMDGYFEDFIPLVRAGLGINVQDKYGRTPLYMAAKYGRVNCLRPLYVLGANLEIPNTKKNQTPLHSACFNEQPGCVEELILLGAEVNSADKQGFTPLHQTANIECLTLLINNKADLNAASESGLTPLLNAVVSEKYDLAQFFLDQGADPMVVTRQGHSLLHLSLEQSPPVFLEALLAKYSFDGSKQNITGNTPLHNACFGSLEAFALLLKKYPEACDIKNDFGQTPLDLAIMNQQDDKIRLLMGQPEIDCTTLKGYGEKFCNISQNHLSKQFKKYLKLKKRELSYLDNRGNCAAFSFLFCYYASLGKIKQYKQLQEKMSAWDGKEGALQYPVDVPGLIEPYTCLEELFEQWINDVAWFQHTSEGLSDRKFRSKVLDLKQKDIKKLYNVVKPAGTSLHIYANSYFEVQTPLQWKEKLSLASLYPKISLLHHSICHAMASQPGKKDEPIFYDPNSADDYVNILNLRSFHDTLQKRFNIGKRIDKRMRIVIPFFSFNPLNSASMDSVPNCPVNKLTPFHIALLYNDMKLLEECCKNKPELINAGDDEKSTPLHYAAKYANVKAADLLLAHRADANATDEFLQTPLMLASLSGALKVAVRLVEKGAIVDAKDLTSKSALFYACEDDAKMAQFLIDKGAILELRDMIGNTALFSACRANSRKCISLLKSNGANLDFTNNHGDTPLHAAIRAKAYKSIKKLIELGADVNAVNKKGKAPLHIAAGLNDKKALKILLKAYADINCKDTEHNTPLHDAVQSSAVECIKELLVSKAELSENLNKHTPFHTSAILKPTLAALFLEQGVNPDLKNSSGMTPLIYAAANGRIENVELLLAYNADINAQNFDGQPALFWALFKKQFKTAEFLLSKKPLIHVADIHNQTALSIASLQGATNILKFLITKGANLNQQVVGGKTPLFAALQNNHYECFKLLLDHGADLKPNLRPYITLEHSRT